MFDLDEIGGKRFLDALIDEVLAAGEVALGMFRAGRAVAETKPDRSPVTAADRAVEERIRQFLQTRLPQAEFVGEESGGSDQPGTAALRFIVDPIDGTRGFIRGMDTWSVLVGLEAAGKPVLGIAFLPAKADLFVGLVGDGAYVNGRPVHLSKIAQLADALITHGGLAQFSEKFGQLAALSDASYTQRGIGDFGNYHALLLGRADAVIDPALKPWDMCAPAAIIRAAGGRFTAENGEESIYRGYAVASNGLVHEEVLALLRRAQSSQ